MSLEFPADVRRFIIGIWRFREAGRPRQWCATYCYRGHYYDAVGGATEQQAIEAVRRGLKKLRGRR